MVRVATNPVMAKHMTMLQDTAKSFLVEIKAGKADKADVLRWFRDGHSSLSSWQAEQVAGMIEREEWYDFEEGKMFRAT